MKYGMNRILPNSEAGRWVAIKITLRSIVTHQLVLIMQKTSIRSHSVVHRQLVSIKAGLWDLSIQETASISSRGTPILRIPNALRRINEILSLGYCRTPPTSFSPNSSPNLASRELKSKGYGGTFGSAHAAAVIRQLISGGPTYLFSFQLKDGPLQSDGTGWGLITNDDNGLKKSRAISYTIFWTRWLEPDSNFQVKGHG